MRPSKYTGRALRNFIMVYELINYNQTIVCLLYIYGGFSQFLQSNHVKIGQVWA